MATDWLKGLRRHCLFATASLLATAGVSRADEREQELRALIEQQGKQIQELRRQLEAIPTSPRITPAVSEGGAAAVDEASVRRIVGDYLKENPGAGMPPSVQTGYETGRGFAIRSTNDPKYIKWDDDCKIPFELRIRGRIQLALNASFPGMVGRCIVHVSRSHRETEHFHPGSTPTA